MKTHCPVCDRFCGPVATCPYCDTTIPLPQLYRRLRIGAWLVATIGLGILIIAAGQLPPDSVPIAELTPSMQFARLHFEGTLTAAPRFSRNQRSASTQLDDGSGQTLRIVFLDEAAQALTILSTPLQSGDRFRAHGSLRLQAGEQPVLFIRSPDQFHIPERTP